MVPITKSRLASPERPSASSTSSSSQEMLSPDKLQQLCQSSVASKLHIPSHDLPEKYVVSIPFTLQLPPKISRKNVSIESSSAAAAVQPSSASIEGPSSGVLFYNGKSYQKLEMLASDLERARSQNHGDNSEFAGYIEPPQPPSPNRHSPGHKIDNLSVIEEISDAEFRQGGSAIRSLPSLRLKSSAARKQVAKSSSASNLTLGETPVIKYQAQSAAIVSPTLQESKGVRWSGNSAQLSSRSNSNHPSAVTSPTSTSPRRKPPPPMLSDTLAIRLNSELPPPPPPSPPLPPLPTSTLSLDDLTKTVEGNASGVLDDTPSPFLIKKEKVATKLPTPASQFINPAASDDSPLRDMLPGLALALAPDESTVTEVDCSNDYDLELEDTSYTSDSVQDSVDLTLSPSRCSILTNPSLLQSQSAGLPDADPNEISLTETAPLVIKNSASPVQTKAPPMTPLEQQYMNKKKNDGRRMSSPFPNDNSTSIKTLLSGPPDLSSHKRRNFISPRGEIEIPDFSYVGARPAPLRNTSLKRTLRRDRSKSTSSLMTWLKEPAPPPAPADAPHPWHKTGLNRSKSKSSTNLLGWLKEPVAPAPAQPFSGLTRTKSKSSANLMEWLKEPVPVSSAEKAPPPRLLPAASPGHRRHKSMHNISFADDLEAAQEKNKENAMVSPTLAAAAAKTILTTTRTVSMDDLSGDKKKSVRVQEVEVPASSPLDDGESIHTTHQVIPRARSINRNPSKRMAHYFDSRPVVSGPLLHKGSAPVPQSNLPAPPHRVTSDLDNKGQGRRFSFPNPDDNAASIRTLVTSPPVDDPIGRSGSTATNNHRRSYVLPNGQIEIPDFGNGSVRTGPLRNTSLRRNGNHTRLKSSSSLMNWLKEPAPPPAPADAPHPWHKLNRTRSKSSANLLDWLKEPVAPAPAQPFSGLNRTKSKSSANLMEWLKEPIPVGSSETTPSVPANRLKRNVSTHLNNTLMSTDASIKANSTTMTTSTAAPNPFKQDYNLTSAPIKKSSLKLSKSVGNLNALAGDMPLKMNVERPPERVNYPVDFREAPLVTRGTITRHGRHGTPQFTFNSQYSAFPLNGKANKKDPRLQTSSHSSYQSSGPFSRKDHSVAGSSNVVIDLTKEDDDDDLVRRTDSYRSIKERDRSGNTVEVVLVDEDYYEDLVSFYSKYHDDEVVRRRICSNNSSSNKQQHVDGSANHLRRSLTSQQGYLKQPAFRLDSLHHTDTGLLKKMPPTTLDKPVAVGPFSSSNKSNLTKSRSQQLYHNHAPGPMPTSKSSNHIPDNGHMSQAQYDQQMVYSVSSKYGIRPNFVAPTTAKSSLPKYPAVALQNMLAQQYYSNNLARAVSQSSRSRSRRVPDYDFESYR